MPKTSSENESSIVLIMLPYAGGSAQAYYKLGKIIQNKINIQIATIEYAGRGTRFRKPLATNFTDLVDDAKRQIIKSIEKYKKENQKTSFVLFGHSMGGLVLIHSLEELCPLLGDSLRGIILSSCLPPERIQGRKSEFQTEQQLLDYLCMLRNVPIELANSMEFKQYILPYVSNDFRILDEYDLRLNVVPRCSFHAIWGDLDYGITKENMEGWQKYSIETINWYKVNGTHFYFEENVEMAASTIVNIIDRCKGEYDDCK